MGFWNQLLEELPTIIKLLDHRDFVLGIVQAVGRVKGIDIQNVKAIDKAKEDVADTLGGLCARIGNLYNSDYDELNGKLLGAFLAEYLVNFIAKIRLKLKFLNFLDDFFGKVDDVRKFLNGVINFLNILNAGYSVYKLVGNRENQAYIIRAKEAVSVLISSLISTVVQWLVSKACGYFGFQLLQFLPRQFLKIIRDEVAGWIDNYLGGKLVDLILWWTRDD